MSAEDEAFLAVQKMLDPGPSHWDDLCDRLKRAVDNHAAIDPRVKSSTHAIEQIAQARVALKTFAEAEATIRASFGAIPRANAPRPEVVVIRVPRGTPRLRASRRIRP